MAKTRRKAGKRVTADRDGSRARKSGVSTARKPGLRQPKPAKTDPSKRKPSLQPEIARLKRQLKAARLQLEASAEIQRAVANATGDAAGPLQLIAETTAGLFKASSVSIQLAEGSEFTQEYRVGAIAKRVGSAYPRSNIKVGGRNLPGTVVAESRQIHIPDLDQLDPSMADFPGLPHARAGGARTVCGTPLRREHKAIGALIVFRDRLLPFTGDELALLQSFADQAVIAIENARLFNETREALERQGATSDILRAISRSPTDVQPVFDAIVLTAVRLTGCDLAFFLRCDGATYLQMARATPEGLQTVARPPEHIDPDGNFPSRAIFEKKTLHLPDWSLIDLPEKELWIHETFGIVSSLYLPLLRAGECIGLLVLAGKRSYIFGDREIALAESFRDQAVIAIENARLFNETQEALGRQTATADILRIISRSVAHAAPVFDTILESCQRLFNPYDAAVYLVEGDRVRGVARRGPGVGDWGTDSMPLAGSSTGLAIAQRRPLHFPDLANKADLPEDKRDTVRLAGGMSVLYAPIISESRGVGSLVVTRRPKKPFSETEIEFIQSFADQAAIAIENARLFKEVEAKTRDLGEALEQQTATSEVLAVISRSPSDLQPVLQAISDTAARLCGSEQTMFFRYDGKVFRILASWNFPPEVHEMLERRPLMPGHPSAIGRAGASLKPVCIPDVLADPAYGLTGEQSRARYRATLAVPLLREGQLVGALSLNRSEPGAFTEKQIELVATFADQAVIAIENARLFNETKEALAYQTGSSNVLRVIASSPTDVEPVLKEIVESARELCEANDAVVLLKDADHLRFSAHSGPIPVTLDKWPISRNWTAGRAFVDQTPVHVHDMLSDEGAEFPDARAMGQSTGATIHTVLSVPLLRGNESIGAILLRRTEVRPFNDKQINLLSTFADQAVIAIQNARLFNETKEALERQTATAEILKVIASSPDDVQPVFQAIAERSNHLVGGFATTVVSIIDEVVHLSAFTSTTPAADAAIVAFYPRPLSGFSYGDAIRRGETHRIVDIELEPGIEPDQLTMVRQRGWRSALWVPLLLEGMAIGAIGVTRVEPGTFADHHVDMLKTFADQAVIAISNVNLFRQVQERTRDLEESLQQQTATSEVLQVISRSVFDLKTVLQTLLESAAGLCDASICILFQSQGDLLHVGASYGGTPEFVEYLSAHPHRFDRTTVAGRAAVERRTIHIPDIAADTEYGLPQSIKLGGWQSIIGVPLLRDGEVLGVLDLARPVAGPFTPRQIQLIETFADQAVIAIENARLFDEVQQRTKELAASLDDLRTAQDRLVQTEKLASLGQLTAGIAHEIKNPLNFVNNFSALSVELIDEMTDIFENPTLDVAGRRKELDEIRELLKSNLEKVVQHGKRADSIVKNMLLHSREGSGDQRAVDINALLDESLNLAYHGARAEKPDFNITLQRDLDPDAGVIELFPQEITRALLNLISNGFYAASKREAENGEADFEPVLSAATRNLGNHIEIRIRDNGTGIPPEVKEKMFNPFFTTKPPGDGTGLGLSMSHDIIVKQHGGRIEMDTQPGQFTEFTIVLPRAASLASNRKNQTPG